MDYVFDSPFFENSMDESLIMAQHDRRPVALPDLATHILHCSPHAMVYYSLSEVAVVVAAAAVLFEVTVEIVADVSLPKCLRHDLIVALTHHADDGDGDDVTSIVN
jgi:hypothetical protein